MKKKLRIDENLLKAARAACGAATNTETVRLGLKELLRQAAYRQIAQPQVSEPGAKDTRRRREKIAHAQEAAHIRYSQAVERLSE